MADPMAAIQKIYNYFKQPLSADAQTRMRAWDKGNPQHKHGKHRYSDAIGVSKEAIRERFATYMQVLNVRAE